MRPQAEFVEQALETLGITQTELGVRLKKPNAYATVHGWITGKFKLGYEDTVAILAMLGDQPAAATESDADWARRVEARMDAALNNQGKVLRAVEELARAMDGLTDLVEASLTAAKPVPQRKRRTA